MDRWHEEDFLGPLWKEINDEFGVGRNALYGFVEWLSCNTQQHRAYRVSKQYRRTDLYKD